MPTHDQRPAAERSTLAWIVAHGLALLFAAWALFFAGWFVFTNPALLSTFRSLGLSWIPAGSTFDFTALAWGVGGVVLFGLIGWLYLDGMEVYLPRSARLALSFIFGMGLTGVLLELLAIPFWLTRGRMCVALAGLLAVLVFREWRAWHRPPIAQPGAEGDPREQLLRRALAEAALRRSVQPVRGFFSSAWFLASITLLVLINGTIFWHALLYPEVYWDSLILYLGYARMTFLEHGFPIKVTGQVGIGLGANYPHLFAVLGAGIATAAGEWSELPQRLIAPLCGVCSTILVFHTALRLTRHTNFALGIALLYRATPLGIAYDTYASDYALAILFAAAFLYLTLLYIETALPGYFAAVTLLIALSMHLNYLMGILWLPWLITIFMTHFGAGFGVEENIEEVDPRREAPWSALPERPGLMRFFSSRSFWVPALGAAVIGSTWHIRNWIVTGNPVYAFFYRTLGGDNITPAVMRAAEEEWKANGAGIARLDGLFDSRLHAAWTYFTGISPNGGLMWPQAYQLAPLAMGFAFPAVLLWGGRCLGTGSRRGALIGESPAAVRFGAVVLSLAVGLLLFHFVMAPFYLYQVIKLIPCLALLAALAWPLWRMRPWRVVFALLTLTIGVLPGLAMGLMGFKIGGVINLPGERQESPLSLFVMRHPLPTAEQFYQWRYGADPRMWDYINRHLPGQKLLTHENRHLVFDPSIQIVQLDDWDMQPLWNLTYPADRVRRLVQVHGIQHYLFIPNELACATNARMGTQDFIDKGFAKLIFEAGENRLYQLILPEPSPTPTPVPESAEVAPEMTPEALSATPAIQDAPTSPTG